MPVFNRSELPVDSFEPEYCSATGSRVGGEYIEARFLFYPGGSEIKTHSSAGEQIHTIVRGKATYRVGNEQRTIGAGEAVLIRPHMKYAAQISEDLEVIYFADARPLGAGEDDTGDTAFFKWDQMDADFITPKYSPAHGPNIRGGHLEVGLFSYPAGGEGKRHSHPNEQIQVPLKGRSDMVIGGERVSVEPGWVMLIPANTEHEGSIVKAYVTVNCKNIVEGWSVHNAQWEK